MGLSGRRQRAVGVFLSRYVGCLSVYLQSMLVISLRGLPFIGVFFRKHELMSFIRYIYGGGYVTLLFLGFFLSYSYCLRLVLLLVKGLGGLRRGYSSSFVIISGLSIGATLLNAFGLGVLSEDLTIGAGYSLVVLIVQVVGCVTG